MINLYLKRFALRETYTIGHLYINETYFCDTLEDRVRDLPLVCPDMVVGHSCRCREKVYAETAIPDGSYRVIVNHSPRFKRLLPRLLNVPHFEGILIHRGNSDKDSAGCILLGENKVKGRLINSTGYEQKLVELLKNEKEITIHITY